MSTPATETPQYPAGMTLIQNGQCPIGATNPMACWSCHYGHATECHYPMDCEEAECGHFQTEAAAEDEGFGLVVDPEDLDGAFDEPFEPESELQRLTRYAQAAATFEEYFPGGVAEFERLGRISAGGEPACAKCGCSQSRACLGGSVWATERLCSRCV